MIRVIVAGSRDFNNQDVFDNAMTAYLPDVPNSEIEIISGGCRGADAMAEEYAKYWGMKFREFPAYWNQYGKSAGPRRNERMAQYATEGDRGILIAFPIGESRGTRNMVKLAKQYGLEVHVVECDGL